VLPPLVLPPLVPPPLVLPPDVLVPPVVVKVPLVLVPPVLVPPVLVPLVLTPVVPEVLVVEETPPVEVVVPPPFGFGAGRSFGTAPADASAGAPDELSGTSTLLAFAVDEGVLSSPPLVALPIP
jgi:hypothetical protein